MLLHHRVLHSARALPNIQMLAANEVWAAYEAAADSNGLLTDICTQGAISVVSDGAAQLTQMSRSVVAGTPSGYDSARTNRFLVFGVFDGSLSHLWFDVLDKIVGEDGSLTETLLKVASDACVYTPLWCCWFLAAFVVLEGKDPRTVPNVIRTEWLELFRGNLGFFLPLTGLIYGFVPRDERVLAFGVASLVYTAILSLWNSARQTAAAEVAGSSGGSAEAAALELCQVSSDDPECVPLPTPPRAAATLSFGVRRALVTARRGGAAVLGLESSRGVVRSTRAARERAPERPMKND